MIFKAKKSLGQNFLVDLNIVRKIINTVDVSNKDILEIGPGKGILTDQILKKKPKSLILVEKDNLLSEKLRLKYIKNDITKEDFEKILYKRYKIKQKKIDNNIYLQNLYYIFADLLRNCISKLDMDEYYKYTLEAISWIDYYNKLFYNKISKTYGGVCYNILVYNDAGDIKIKINSINKEYQSNIKFKDTFLVICSPDQKKKYEVYFKNQIDKYIEFKN